MLQLGGIGFVHYNMSIEEQVHVIKRVKQQAAGYEANPIVVSPNHSPEQLKDLKVAALYMLHLHSCNSCEFSHTKIMRYTMSLDELHVTVKHAMFMLQFFKLYWLSNCRYKHSQLMHNVLCA